MSRHISANAELAAKYAVGEIADFIGVPTYYDTGTSKWLLSNTWVAGSSLPAAATANLSETYANAALTDSALFINTYPNLHSIVPPAVVGTTRCVYFTDSARYEYAYSMTISASNVAIINTGLGVGFYAGTVGGGAAITSDGTKFWGFAASSASAFGAKSSTDGVTWAAETLTGLPTFTTASTYAINNAGNGSATTNTRGLSFSCLTYAQLACYCGARHLIIGLNASNQYIATRSTNGTTWGGNESTTILGSATLAANPYCWINVNGNNAFIALGGIARFSSDGGATWAAATNGQTGANITYRVNATDPARIARSNSGSDLYISTDSGATWTVKTLPDGMADKGFNGRGATWMYIGYNGYIYKSTDDGATWNIYPTPAGINNVSGVFADANRWYLFSKTENKIATSTDASTWTVRNISNIADTPVDCKTLAATDANTVVLLGNYGERTLHSADGGVTWRWNKGSSSTTYNWGGGYYITANTVGTPMFLEGRLGSSSSITAGYAFASSVQSHGAVVRASGSTVSPLRTGALAYVRIA